MARSLYFVHGQSQSVVLSFTSDEQLVTVIQGGGQGRERATHFLMQEHLGFVHKLRHKLHLQEDEVLDCYIDALADVVEQIGNGRFRGLSKVSTYLYQITYFRCVDVHRKRGKELEDQQEFAEMEDLSQRIGKQLEIESEIKKLHHHLENLGSPCKGILLDWAWWGYTMKEIAQRNALGSAEIAKSRKYQCLMQLRKIMGILS